MKSYLTLPALSLTGLLAFAVPVSVLCANESAAGACMVPPTNFNVVTSRFGIFRGGGKDNFGGNKAPHQHDGLDFRTAGKTPIYATTEGVITFIGPRGSAGNTILVTRDNKDVVGFYHLSGFAPGMRVGTRVSAGQTIGLAGNTNAGAQTRSKMDIHLHLVYGLPKPADQRSVSFDGNVGKSGNPLRPSQLANKLSSAKEGIGWRTDPSPYFCDSFRIDDGNPHRVSQLGATTKEQHQILFGNVPEGGYPPNVQFDAMQIAAANTATILAAADGEAVEFHLDDGDGFGALPMPPMGDYALMSPSEMMHTEANRRFMSADWNTRVTEVSSRALYIDLLLAKGVSVYLADAIYNKKQRIEGLLAAYTALKMGGVQAETDEAHDRVMRARLTSLIQ